MHLPRFGIHKDMTLDPTWPGRAHLSLYLSLDSHAQLDSNRSRFYMSPLLNKLNNSRHLFNNPLYGDQVET